MYYIRIFHDPIVRVTDKNFESWLANVNFFVRVIRGIYVIAWKFLKLHLNWTPACGSHWCDVNVLVLYFYIGRLLLDFLRGYL